MDENVTIVFDSPLSPAELLESVVAEGARTVAWDSQPPTGGYAGFVLGDVTAVAAKGPDPASLEARIHFSATFDPDDWEEPMGRFYDLVWPMVVYFVAEVSGDVVVYRTKDMPVLRRLKGRLFVNSEWPNPVAELERRCVPYEAYPLRQGDFCPQCEDPELIALASR